MTVKTAAEVPSDVPKHCSLVHYGMSLSMRNCIESNSNVPANHVEMQRLLWDSTDGVARNIYPAINRAWITVEPKTT